MAKIGNLVAGLGGETVLNQQFLYQFISVGEFNAPNVLREIVVSVGGNTTLNIRGSNFCSAFSSLAGMLTFGAASEIAGVTPDDQGSYMKRIIPIAGGSKANETVSYKFVNNSSAPAPIRGFGIQKYDGTLWAAGMDLVQQSSSNVFSGYDFLLVDLSSFSSCSATFSSGWTEELSLEDLSQVLSTSILFDQTVWNTDFIAVIPAELIPEVRLFASDTQNLNVCKVFSA